MMRVLFTLLFAAALSGCGEVIDVAEPPRLKEGPPVVGQLPLALTDDLRAAGAITIAPYNGPWGFRQDKEGRLHEGDLLQVNVFGVPGLEARYIEYVNEEGYWIPENVRPVKGRNRTQQDVAQDFPRRARIPETPGLRIAVFGPYSKDCYVVGGEVPRWGYYAWREGVTLKDAIKLAGGPKRDMPQGTIRVVRGDRVVTFSLRIVLDAGVKPFLIKPLDAISVGERLEIKFDARNLGVPLPPPPER